MGNPDVKFIRGNNGVKMNTANLRTLGEVPKISYHRIDTVHHSLQGGAVHLWGSINLHMTIDNMEPIAKGISQIECGLIVDVEIGRIDVVCAKKILEFFLHCDEVCRDIF